MDSFKPGPESHRFFPENGEGYTNKLLVYTHIETHRCCALLYTHGCLHFLLLSNNFASINGGIHMDWELRGLQLFAIQGN